MSNPPKRRWFRFSLRAMLVAWTVLGVWLGWEIDGAVKQRRAVEVVRKLGGMVGYRHQRLGSSMGAGNWDPTIEPWAPRWLRRVVGDDCFVSVFEVYLAHFGNPVDPPPEVLARLSDDDLATLAGLKQLERLELAGAPVTPQGLAHLAGLQHLEYLDLRNVTITDEHLEQLGRLRQLKDLRLGSHGQPAIAKKCRITDEGLAHLKHLTHLQTLFLYDLPISDAALARLNELPALREILRRPTQASVVGTGSGDSASTGSESP